MPNVLAMLEECSVRADAGTVLPEFKCRVPLADPSSKHFTRTSPFDKQCATPGTIAAGACLEVYFPHLFALLHANDVLCDIFK